MDRLYRLCLYGLWVVLSLGLAGQGLAHHFLDVGDILRRVHVGDTAAELGDARVGSP